MKLVSLVFVLSLLCLSMSGPLTGWACMPCVQACLITGVAYAPCVIACCGFSMLGCFDNQTTVISPQGIIQLDSVQKGTLVLTQTLNGTKKWTQVKFVHRNQSNHEFVKITTDSNNLTVTNDHVMIVDQKLMHAQNLKVGMFLKEKKILNIEKINKFTKITVITEQGTILANGILTATICGDYIDKHGNSLEILEKWKQDHKWLIQSDV